MNEKIKELAEQADAYAHLTGEGMMYQKTRERYTEKFAELIVRECIEVFSKDMPDPMSPDYQLGTLNEVVNRVCNVAEHFGVEE